MLTAVGLAGFAMGVGAVLALTGQPAQAPPTADPPPITAQAQAPVQTQLASFGRPVTDPAGLSVTALWPEKIKGGVRFTIALTNPTDRPITVDVMVLGPHDSTFNGRSVPMTMTPGVTELAPGEGYTYQCDSRLPDMNPGQLAFTFGQTVLVGRVTGD